MTARFPAGRFQALAQRRASEGFTAVQIVVGIPPEVGPQHPSAASEVGPAWSSGGTPNGDYLELARHRLGVLLDAGLTPVVYGAWGPQVDWLGVDAMARWWRAIVSAVDDLPVVYCLTGEAGLWLDRPDRLLPSRSTEELYGGKRSAWLLSRAAPLLRRVKRPPTSRSTSAAGRRRVAAWTDVLVAVAERTRRPIIVHPVASVRGTASVARPDLLAAETVQTGHSRTSAPRLWREPFRAAIEGRPFLNLEPWYEGILGDFGTSDQLDAYWMSVACGASGHGYGCHGVWNAGDGQFLAHWGSQTLDEALALPTAALLGASHRVFRSVGRPGRPSIRIETAKGGFVRATRAGLDGSGLTYVVDVRLADVPEATRYFVPAEGRFSNVPPEVGSVVAVHEPGALTRDAGRSP